MKTASGLELEDTKLGTGTEATRGKRVTVHYVGTLDDGTEFDSSRNRGPFEVEIGKGLVIRGWEEGIPGMRVGGRRRLVIPPGMAYGARSIGSIPSQATLTFEVELLAIKP